MTRREEQEDWAEKTREKIGKKNQVTAVRFQTAGGGGWGGGEMEGEDIRHTQPIFRAQSGVHRVISDCTRHFSNHCDNSRWLSASQKLVWQLLEPVRCMSIYTTTRALPATAMLPSLSRIHKCTCMRTRKCQVHTLYATCTLSVLFCCWKSVKQNNSPYVWPTASFFPVHTDLNW